MTKIDRYDKGLQAGSMLTVIKNDHAGRERWRYTGFLLARGPNWVQLEARFNRPDHLTDYHTFRQGDRFIEWFYSDRWYNIFQMHRATDDRLVGWYCNITHPAHLGLDRIVANDLALDVFITPAGSLTILDEAEFAALPLDDVTRVQAQRAVTAITQRVAQRHPPFDCIVDRISPAD